MSDTRVGSNVQSSSDGDREVLSTENSLESAGVKAGLRSGITGELTRLDRNDDQPAAVNPLKEAIERLRQPKSRRQRKTLESFPWEARMRAARAAEKRVPQIGDEVPWERVSELPQSGSYSFGDEDDFPDDDNNSAGDSEPTDTSSAADGDFPWKERQLPVKCKEATQPVAPQTPTPIDVKAAEKVHSEKIQSKPKPTLPEPSTSNKNDVRVSGDAQPATPQIKQAPGDVHPPALTQAEIAAIAALRAAAAQRAARPSDPVAPAAQAAPPADRSSWIPDEWVPKRLEPEVQKPSDVVGWVVPKTGPTGPAEAKKPERAPSAPHTHMSYIQAAEAARELELLKPESAIVEKRLEETERATTDSSIIEQLLSRALEKFLYKTDGDGYVIDFWVRIRYGQPFLHYKWQGTGYREFDDEKNDFSTKSSMIDCPRAKVNPQSGAIEQEQFTGNRRHFFPDGRYEEHDPESRVLYANNGKGLSTAHKYDPQGNLVLSIVSQRGKWLKELHLPDSGLSSEDACGYEYKTPRTGHIEILTREESGTWNLQLGDQARTFPSSCTLSFDRSGNRKITDENELVLYEGLDDGTTLMRDEFGHIVETRSEGGCTTIFKRAQSGQVDQVIVRNSQGQIVEHTTRDANGHWDSPEMDDVEVDDRTGDYMVSFTTGDEVIRNIDRSQELRNSSDNYKLDADRIIEYMKPPLSIEKEREMRADLAEIAKLNHEFQHQIYDCIRQINDAMDGPTKLTRAQRGRLITSMTRQIAHPDAIKQGNKDTCVAANVEKTIAMNHPELYAVMLANLAIYGEYFSEDGKTVMKAQRQLDGSLASYSDSSKTRSPVSEIMQTSLTQLALPEGEEYRSYPSGYDPVPNGIDRSTDTGERILKDGQVRKFGGLDREAQIRILNKLMPLERYVVAHVSTTGELDSAWQANGCKPPMYIMVRIDSPDANGEGGIGTHAVSITHIEYDSAGEPLAVYYENPGDADDHSYPNGRGVPLDDFVKGMQSTAKDPLSGQEKPLPLTAVVGKRQ